MQKSEISKLVTCIEENLRASPTAGLGFVDSRNHGARLLSRQNHVVYGRRGAGKTSVVKSLRDSDALVQIYINLEDYKDITFPNIVISVLLECLATLASRVKTSSKIFGVLPRPQSALQSELVAASKTLKKLLHEPDDQIKEVSNRETFQSELNASAGIADISASGKQRKELSEEVRREFATSKMNELRINLPNYKKLLDNISNFLGNKSIFLVLDDFYFIPKEIQPDFIDYFHRMTKGTELFLKLATIKHRSKLYKRSHSHYIGVELGHDIFEVDMDYSLDKFEELQAFMKQLLNGAIHSSGAQIAIDDIFAGDGFAQLCLASGGVPRDFLSLFVRVANRSTASNNAQIGKVDVTDAAIANISSKLESMKKDSGDEDLVLQECLTTIKKHVYTDKRTNAFLIGKDDIDKDAFGRQAIRELVDLRLIHLIDHNTSKAPSDGRRYEAYILDIGLYDNSRPRNFSQVDPGQRDDKARKDPLRASPVFALSSLSTTNMNQPHQLELVLTEE